MGLNKWFTKLAAIGYFEPLMYFNKYANVLIFLLHIMHGSFQLDFGDFLLQGKLFN